MAKEKRTFGKSLNALSAAIETISETVDNPITSPVQPQETTPQGGGVAAPVVPVITPAAQIAEPTQPIASVTTSENVANAEVPVAPKPKATPKGKKAPQPETTEERTKPVSLYLPVSVYKRLLDMKMDMDGESLKSLGLRAIEEMLKRKGY